MRVKVIAYYLPQFHAIPENDKWWGEGFTEWDNVKRGVAFTPNQYQPRVPLNGNYYNLTSKDTLLWQAELAKSYGVYGFCLYHYWFDGHLLLEKPIHLIRDNPDIPMRYCICWANENWTNGWVSDTNTVLLSNDFDDEEMWVKHIRYLLSFFKDRRYIYVDGKPLVVIYYPSLIKKIDKMVAVWRDEAIKAGFPGLTVVYQHNLFSLDYKAKKGMFDYGIEFEPGYSLKTLNNIDVYKLNRSIRFKNFVRTKLHINPRGLHSNTASMTPVEHNYDLVWREILSQKLDKRMFPGAFVDWDNTARKGVRGSYMAGANPEAFKTYFRMLLERARHVYEKDYLFLFAWNEWGESGYLEPDERNGYGYLQAIKTSLEETGEWPNGDEER